MFRTGLGRAATNNQLVEGTGEAYSSVDVDYVEGDARTAVALTKYNNVFVGNSNTNYTGTTSIIFGGLDNDYINTNNVLIPSTGDFTLETWVYVDQYTNRQQSTLFSQYTSGVAGRFLVVISGSAAADTSGKISVFAGSGSGFTYGPSILSTNTWYHVAISRSGNTLRIFLNGSLEIENTNFTDSIEQTDTWIGSDNYSSANRSIDGNLQEIRISNTARYTSNFTPHTTPHVNDANTLLLIHGDTLTDDNSITNTQTQYYPVSGPTEPARTAVSLTNNGATAGDADTAVTGGSSIDFDGSNVDYVVADNSTTDILSGTDDFTVETWAKLTSDNGSWKILVNCGWPTSSQRGWALQQTASNNNGVWTFNYRGQGDGNSTLYSTVTANTNQWYHLAVVRNGSTLTFYVDGVDSGSTSITNIGYSGKTLAIAVNDALTGENFDGKLQEIRVSNTARYTANFTPHTTPHVDDEHTLLLIHGDAIVDDNSYETPYTLRTPVTTTAYGGVSVDNTEYKTGTGSLDFNGSDSYIETSQPVIPTTGDFTAEAWVYLTNANHNSFIGQGLSANSGGYFMMVHTSDGDKFRFRTDAFTLNSAASPALNTWHHLAIVRSGNTFSMFVNGIKEASTISYSGSMKTDTNTTIADDYFENGNIGASGGRTLLGNMDNIRISSTARYTSNFTPPTEQFEDDSDTLLLIHGDDGWADQVADRQLPEFIEGRTEVALTNNGATVITDNTAPVGSDAIAFDNTNDFIDTGVRNFNGIRTVEFWCYSETNGSEDLLVTNRHNGSGYGGLYIAARSDNSTMWILSSSNNSSWDISLSNSTAFSRDTWHHFAWTWDGNIHRFFLDGTQVHSHSSTSSIAQDYADHNSWHFGKDPRNGNYLGGKMSEIRISNIARYTSNFTPHTTPHVNDANTLLLIHGDSIADDNLIANPDYVDYSVTTAGGWVPYTGDGSGN